MTDRAKALPRKKERKSKTAPYIRAYLKGLREGFESHNIKSPFVVEMGMPMSKEVQKSFGLKVTVDELTAIKRDQASKALPAEAVEAARTINDKLAYIAWSDSEVLEVAAIIAQKCGLVTGDPAPATPDTRRFGADSYANISENAAKLVMPPEDGSPIEYIQPAESALAEALEALREAVGWIPTRGQVSENEWDELTALRDRIQHILAAHPPAQEKP